MNKVIFYCDESGAKGYANQDEAFPGEVGVFAGILVPEERFAIAKPVFDQIAVHYMPASGKLHIADLPPERQDSLRTELFAAIRSAGIPCFWYAIHVAGLHSHHQAQTARLKQLGEELRSARGGAEPRIKRGSPREDPASMHVELFSGLYSHLVAFLLERGQLNVDVEIRTDHVDTPLIKSFTEIANELLSNDPQVATASGFDTVEKKIVKRTATVSMNLPSELEQPSPVHSLSIVTVPDNDGMVLAADVIANSLNYLFKCRDVDKLYGALNCRDAIASHPLAAHLAAFRDWGSGDWIGDVMYRHPEGKP